MFAADRIPCAVTLPWMFAAMLTATVIPKKAAIEITVSTALCPVNFIANLFLVKMDLDTAAEEGPQIRRDSRSQLRSRWRGRTDPRQTVAASGAGTRKQF